MSKPIMTSRDIAEAIMHQLGGVPFNVMTGAKDFLVVPNGLRFKFGRNKTKDTICTVRLDLGKDLYEMEFGHTRKVGFVPEYFIGKLYTDLYFDQLRQVFSEYTGLELVI